MNVTDLARPEIRSLTPYASARAIADTDGVGLDANENPWPPAGDGSMALNRYPEPQPRELKSLLAERYSIDPDHLLLTRGSDEGIDLLVRTFCRCGLDRVAICPPCFGMYALSARVQGAGVREVALVETAGGFVPDFDALAAGPPCRLYFLCSPNNPTGTGIDADDVLDLARRVAGHGLVVLDEAYVEFSARQSLAAEAGGQPNLVVLRTLSKAHALAGCRIGALIADPSVVELLGRVIAPYPLPTPAVTTALEALQPEVLARQERQLLVLDEQKQRLVEALQSHPACVRVWPGEANFVLVRVADAAGLVRSAAAAGIRLRDQSAQPGLDGCVRITVGDPAAIDALVEFLERWRP